MSPGRLVVNKIVVERSIIILANTIQFVAPIILCCVESTPENVSVTPFSHTAPQLDLDNGHQYEYVNNQSVSEAMRKFIDKEEASRTLSRWGDVVVKWEKQKTDDPSKDNLRWKRSSVANNQFDTTKTEYDCGRSKVSGFSTSGVNRFVFTNNNQIVNDASKSHNGNKRIYNGNIVKPGDFSWVAQIKIFKGVLFEKSLCSGSIVSEWLIMTSAHCVFDCSVEKRPTLIEPDMISALIGRHEINWWELNIAPSDILFRAIIAPVNIDPCKPRIETDCVFLVTSKKMNLRSSPDGMTSSPSRVCLPEKNDINLDNTKATVVGWGETYADGGRSDELRQGEVTIQSKELCQNAQPDLDPNKTLCALGGAVSCRGDSGGPLMTQDQLGRWVQVGIYSAYVGKGGKCGPNSLMLFNRVTSFWRWAIDSFDIDELIKLKVS